jgi:pyruvate/2-oxoglutarate dehydrogenase complex dihydrolipoamide dehydrogenase (E3) component
MKHYDVIIIGAGQAGEPLSKSLAKAGRTVALIESTHLGGSCVNFGCTPTKAAIASARVAHVARHASEYGIRVNFAQPDFKAVLARAKAIVHQSRSFLNKSFTEHGNPQLICGHAKLAGRDGERFRISAGEQQLSAAQVILDTGTRSVVPPIDGLNEIDYIAAETWLERDVLPKHLVMIGAGAIGLEMAQFYRRMGAEVSVIGDGQQVAEHEDPDVAQAIQRYLEAEGINFVLSAKAIRVRKSLSGISVTVTRTDEQTEQQVDASHVFVATGRKPNTDDLGLDTIGLNTTKKGTLDVDQCLRTSVPGVWAVGDIRGGPMFTHTSWDDYRIVESQLIGDQSRTTNRVVPYAIFTDPELGRVGMSETQARAAGKPIKVTHFEMKHNGKARELGEMEGFIKVIIDSDTQRILGAAVLCSGAAELVHIYVALMNAQAPYTMLENAIQIHPTLSEAIQSAVSEDAILRSRTAASRGADGTGASADYDV